MHTEVIDVGCSVGRICATPDRLPRRRESWRAAAQWATSTTMKDATFSDDLRQVGHASFWIRSARHRHSGSPHTGGRSVSASIGVLYYCLYYMLYIIIIYNYYNYHYYIIIIINYNYYNIIYYIICYYILFIYIFQYVG